MIELRYRLWIFFILSISFLSIGIIPQESNSIIGVYSKKFKGYDAYSIVELLEKGRFKYLSGVGGCQSEITGDWEIQNGELIVFKIDSIYTEKYLHKVVLRHTDYIKEPVSVALDSLSLSISEMKPCYPKLTNAKIKKRKESIIFTDNIDCACVSVKGRHKKI